MCISLCTVLNYTLAIPSKLCALSALAVIVTPTRLSASSAVVPYPAGFSTGARGVATPSVRGESPAAGGLEPHRVRYLPCLTVGQQDSIPGCLRSGPDCPWLSLHIYTHTHTHSTQPPRYWMRAGYGTTDNTDNNKKR